MLDDVWNERRDCWELFCVPLCFANRCQIILTTRNEKVARLMQTEPCYHLNCLTSEQIWALFRQAAFIVEQESDVLTNLIQLGKSIVQKCNDLPLAIKTLGSMWRYETDESRWKDALESGLWDLKEIEGQGSASTGVELQAHASTLKAVFSGPLSISQRL